MNLEEANVMRDLINTRINELDDEWNYELDLYTHLPDKTDADILRWNNYSDEIGTRQNELNELLKRINVVSHKKSLTELS